MTMTTSGVNLVGAYTTYQASLAGGSSGSYYNHYPVQPLTGTGPLTPAQVKQIMDDLGLAHDPADDMSDDDICAELREMIEETS